MCQDGVFPEECVIQDPGYKASDTLSQFECFPTASIDVCKLGKAISRAATEIADLTSSLLR